MQSVSNNKRIAKNTLLLYFRTIVVLVISLYTSRVILKTLGVDDYGIYNVVAGVVAMFSVMSGALSSAISRFITFELGKGNFNRLNVIFSTSLNIQIGISLLVLLLGGTIGVWFLNAKMNIPVERMDAANWVLYCSLIMFCISLISVPYNAIIIAYERMTVFAYISMLEVTLKLLICYLIQVSPIDKLIAYAILLVIVSLIIRVVYGIYCNRHFKESHYKFVYDNGLLKEMAGFAGWSFFTNACYMFNTQGVNVLINLFFGVAVNAARGIAVQVDSAILQFVNNFSMAINPQITKSYAVGNKQEMFMLVCRGAKLSYFLFLLFALPFLVETQYILSLWLEEVPPYTGVFLQLCIIGSMINMLGNTGLTACQATGNIKKYVLWISSIGCLVFPLSYVAFKLGMPVESTYIIFILVYIVVNIVRLYIMKGLLDFPPMLFFKEVVVKIILVTVAAIPVPLYLSHKLSESFLNFLIIASACILFTALCTYLIGLTKNERAMVATQIHKVARRLKLNK